jgi:uncharacterized linocin/CFP29 family protein
MNNWEIDKAQRDQLKWDGDTWNLIQQWLNDEADRARQLRPSLPPFGGPETDPDAIPDLTLSPVPRVVGTPIFVDPSNRSLVAVELRKEFQVFPEQFGSADEVQIQVMTAAALLSEAEDAVIALGQNAGPFLANPAIDVQDRNLNQQTTSLFAAGQPPLPAASSVLDSILNGMQTFEARGHFGPYCFIGAPDVWARAFRRLRNQVDPDIFSINALLCDRSESPRATSGGASDATSGTWYPNGRSPRVGCRHFRYSPAVPAGTAVLLSLGGGSIYLTVPADTTIGYVRQDRNIILDVRVRLRLLVNDPTAIVPLQ